MEISVIIPWYGAKNMAEHFEAIISSTLKPAEVIVANDGWADDSELLEVIEKYSKQIPFLYIKILEDIPWNMPECLNLAVWFTRSELLSIEDCDVIPDANYYRVGSSFFPEYSKFIAHYKNTEGYPSACGIYDRQCLTDIGGWEEDFAGNYGFNDIYLSAKIDTHGFKTYLSYDKLLSVDLAGESKGERDNSVNRELMVGLLKTFPVNTNIFRHPYKIQRFC